MESGSVNAFCDGHIPVLKRGSERSNHPLYYIPSCRHLNYIVYAIETARRPLQPIGDGSRTSGVCFGLASKNLPSASISSTAAKLTQCLAKLSFSRSFRHHTRFYSLSFHSVEVSV